MLSIKQELELIKTNYDKTIDLVDGLKFSQKKQIKTIEYYNNSKYLNGQLDELGREKPFFQILNAICDVENSAKDLDTKDIQITSDDGFYLFLLFFCFVHYLDDGCSFTSTLGENNTSKLSNAPSSIVLASANP